MRVLVPVDLYSPAHNAGAETMLHSMLRALVRRGHDVDVRLTMQTGDPYELDGVKVWPRVSKKDIPSRVPHADLLIGHLSTSPLVAALGMWNRVPAVMVNHNTFPPTKKATIAPTGHLDLVVCNSQWMADDLRAWIAGRSRVRHVPDIIIYRPLVDPAEHGTTPGDHVTLVNLSVGKGGEILRQLAQRMPDVKFLAVTGGYADQVDMAGLPNVEVLPHMPNADMRERVWARTRILLMPSSYESWGRVATEAICSGIPVIAAPTKGLRENLGDAGVFVDRDDLDRYVREIRRLHDPAQYRPAQQAAVARSVEHNEMRLADEEVWVTRAETIARDRHTVASVSGA